MRGLGVTGIAALKGLPQRLKPFCDSGVGVTGTPITLTRLFEANG